MLSLFGWDFLMFALPPNSHYFYLSCLLTNAVSFFLCTLHYSTSKASLVAISTLWGREGVQGTQERVPQSCALHFSSLLLAPLSPSSFLSVSLCLSLLPADLLLPSAFIQWRGAALVREAPVKITKQLGFLGEANTWEKSTNAGIFSFFRKLFLLAAV